MPNKTNKQLEKYQERTLKHDLFLKKQKTKQGMRVEKIEIKNHTNVKIKKS